MAEIELTKTDLEPGQHRGVRLEGHVYVLVANVGGEYFAIDDSCNHAGCLLSEGEMTPEGEIECPCHFFRFSVKDGALHTEPRGCEDQAAYRIEVRDGGVWVDPATLKPV